MTIEFAKIFSSSIEQLILRNPYTPSRIFGRYKDRKRWDSDKAIEVFNREWAQGLRAAVEEAVARDKNLSYEEARVFLNEFEVKFLKSEMQRRSFEYKSFPFIVQYSRPTDDRIELNQIWYVHSHDSDRYLVCVEFNTPEELNAFNELAQRKGFGSGNHLLDEYVKSLIQEDG